MPISQMLLPEFDQEMANTRKLLELFPEDRPDYKLRLNQIAIPGVYGPSTDEAQFWKAAS
jgi:hypothetical protein